MPAITQQYLTADFIKKIGQARNGIGKSQEEISKILGITRQTLSGLENQRLDDIENMRGELKFTNILALSALYDYFARSSDDAREIIDSQEFQIFERDHLDLIFYGSKEPAETLCEAWLRKRSILEGDEIERITVKPNDFAGNHVFFDLHSFYRRIEINGTRQRLQAFSLRLKKMDGEMFWGYMDQRVHTDGWYQMPEIYNLLCDLSQLKKAEKVKVTAMQIGALTFFDAANHLMTDEGWKREEKKVYMVSDDLEMLLNCTSMIPILLTTSGMMINVAALNDAQKKALKDGCTHQVLKDDTPDNGLLRNLFEI